MVDNILSGASFNLSGLPLQIKSQILCCILCHNSNKKTSLFGIVNHNTISRCDTCIMGGWPQYCYKHWVAKLELKGLQQVSKVQFLPVTQPQTSIGF